MVSLSHATFPFNSQTPPATPNRHLLHANLTHLEALNTDDMTISRIRTQALALTLHNLCHVHLLAFAVACVANAAHYCNS